MAVRAMKTFGISEFLEIFLGPYFLLLVGRVRWIDGAVIMLPIPFL